MKTSIALNNLLLQDEVLAGEKVKPTLLQILSKLCRTLAQLRLLSYTLHPIVLPRNIKFC